MPSEVSISTLRKLRLFAMLKVTGRLFMQKRCNAEPKAGLKENGKTPWQP